MTLEGHELSGEDKQRVANAFVLNALVMQDLLDGSKYERSVSNASLAYWLEGLYSYTLDEIISTYKESLTVLRSVPGRVSTFKRKIHDAHARLDILGPAYLCCLKAIESQSFLDFQDANTALQFWLRLTLKDLSWVEEKQYSDYLEFEQEMKLWEYPADILAGMNTIIKRWFSCWDDSTICPRHGNGATTEVRRGKGLEAKYKAFWSCPTGSSQWYQNTYNHKVPIVPGTLVSPVISDCELVSNVISVPKGVDKKRLVIPEPTTHQYFAEGMASSFEDVFRKRREMKIDLRDQTRSRRMALVSSYTHRYATIDLSSASDSITQTLVRSVFQGTAVLPYLFMFRTCNCRLPDGRIVRMEKYAPMGSAMCFPMECTIFSVIVALANERLGIDTDYRIYGDDMIVEERVYNEVCDLLSALHFRVNNEKTFPPSSDFKEACGIEAVRGDDISPCRLSRKWDVVGLQEKKGSNTVHPTMLSGCVDLINRCYDFGLLRCRRYLIQILREVYPHVPFGIPDGIASDSSDNHHLQRRWNEDYQRWERRGQFVLSKSQNGNRVWKYFITLQSRAFSERTSLYWPDDLVDIAVGPTRDTVRYRWFPEP